MAATEDTEKVSMNGADRQTLHLQESTTNQGQPPARIAQVEELPINYYASKLFLGSYAAISASVVGGTAAFAMISPLLTTINTELGPDPNVVWVGYTYSLCGAISYLMIGRLGDLFGRRYLFIGGNFLALIGAIIGAVAKSINTLIVAMTIIGLASSTQISFQIVLGELVPVGKRFGFMATIFAITIPLGGFGAGFGLTFQERTGPGWRSCFYLTAAINAVATILFILFYYPPAFGDIDGRKTKWQAIKGFDFLGLILFTGGFFVLLMGLSWGGVKYPWKSAQVLSTILIGGLTLILFVFWELYGKHEAPYMPMHLFSNVRWVCMILDLSIGAAQFYAMALIWPQMLSSLWPTSGQEYAWEAAIPGILTVGQVFGGFMAHKVSPRKILLFGVVGGSAFIGGAACANEYNQATVITLLVIGYLFVGIQEAVCGTLATVSLKDQREIGTGGGLAGAMRSAVSAIASVIYGSVNRNTQAQSIAKYVPAAAVTAGLPSELASQLILVLTGEAEAATVPGLTPEILAAATHAYRHAVSIAFRNVFLTAFGFGIVSVVCAFFAPTISKEAKGIVAGTLHKGVREKKEEEEEET